MKPTEAQFDGEKGIIIDSSRGIRYLLKRGKKRPNPREMAIKNQLLWWMPEGEDAKLLFCNNSNQLFELNFVPFNSEGP
jgi:hypothetical protein